MAVTVLQWREDPPPQGDSPGGLREQARETGETRGGAVGHRTANQTSPVLPPSLYRHSSPLCPAQPSPSPAQVLPWETDSLGCIPPPSLPHSLALLSALLPSLPLLLPSLPWSLFLLRWTAPALLHHAALVLPFAPAFDAAVTENCWYSASTDLRVLLSGRFISTANRGLRD